MKNTESLPGTGINPGDVTIVNNGSPCEVKLLSDDGLHADYGWYGEQAGRYVTKNGLENMNGKAIWVEVNGQILCKNLTPYNTDWAPIVFEINPDSNDCHLAQ